MEKLNKRNAGTGTCSARSVRVVLRSSAYFTTLMPFLMTIPL